MPFRFLISSVFCVSILTSCKGVISSNNMWPNSLSLTPDNVSSVPLINNQPQLFYMYAKNTGATEVTNIKWNIENLEEDNSIEIKDASECTHVLAGQSCRILLQANKANKVVLHATSNKQTIKLLGASDFIQVHSYAVSNTDDLPDTLSVTPISEINYADTSGSASFFIINNGRNPVLLNAANMSVYFPKNVKLSLDNCPNPIPSGNACQARVIVNNMTQELEDVLNIDLRLLGEVINSDNSTTVLPKQYADTVISARSYDKGETEYLFNRYQYMLMND